MEPKKTMVCTCEKCGNEAEMTVKCEVVVKEKTPPAEKLKRAVVCTQLRQ